MTKLNRSNTQNLRTSARKASETTSDMVARQFEELNAIEQPKPGFLDFAGRREYERTRADKESRRGRLTKVINDGREDLIAGTLEHEQSVVKLKIDKEYLGAHTEAFVEYTQMQAECHDFIDRQIDEFENARLQTLIDYQQEKQALVADGVIDQESADTLVGAERKRVLAAIAAYRVDVDESFSRRRKEAFGKRKSILVP